MITKPTMLKTKASLFWWLAMTLGCGVALSAEASKDKVYHDETFNPNVRTIRLLTSEGPLFSSTFPIDQREPVLLVFDVLELDPDATYGDYSVKIVHCNADWRKSRLYDMDFLGRFNEFQINNEQLSFNTKIPFGQYQWALPRVTQPGNYALQVYQGTNQNDVLFTKRFMVYDRTVGVGAEVLPSADVARRATSQQIEFVVDHGNLDIPNPQQDVYVVVRQNYQWFNALEGLKPTFVRATDRQLEYRPFDMSNNFYAASEFRFFDLRTVNALGQNVGKILREKVPTEVLLLPDQDRAGQAYSQYDDLNGAYVIGNLEQQGGELTADYLLTHFFLEADNPAPGDVYVIGAFNSNVLNQEGKMTYDASMKGYRTTMLLKQGFYSYLYYVDGPNNPYAYDGNHFQTENRYEIFVYTRPIGARADLLIGYTSLVANAQNRQNPQRR